MKNKMLNLPSIFKTYDNEYLKFYNVKEKFSQRSDLHAFILLDKLIPSKMDMISGSMYDKFFIDVCPSELAEVATEEQIVDLIRCGILYDENDDCFSFFA